jgi:two-component SAPR family response regulator
MHKTKDEILDYQEAVAYVKKSTAVTDEEKTLMLKALSDSFYKGIDAAWDTPERERLDALMDKIVEGGD